MTQISGLDHIAITVADIDVSCNFYRSLFGATQVFEYAIAGKPAVRQLYLGGARLSVHQAGNGVELVAKRPTPGSADICMRWSGSIESAAALLREHNLVIIDGPSPRETATGQPSQSVYFRDPDGNLLELMAANPR
jgi:catechol 2,3-dioxygenase-like lactoylglutathione lyase family enzyme